MSQENAEILRRAIEAFNRGDPEAWVAVLAPEFECTATGPSSAFEGGYQPEQERALADLRPTGEQRDGPRSNEVLPVPVRLLRAAGERIREGKDREHPERVVGAVC
jgi:hypothetical protein